MIAPCALGSALNDTTIPRIKARRSSRAPRTTSSREPRHGDDLHARGILYAPDYAINAGGLVNVAQEVIGYDAEKAREKTLEIYDTIHEIAERSAKTRHADLPHRRHDGRGEARRRLALEDRAPRPAARRSALIAFACRERAQLALGDVERDLAELGPRARARARDRRVP